MSLNRRTFLASTSGAALAVTAGCGKAPDALFPGAPIQAAGPGEFAVPDSESIDLISHAINRLSYGPRPGEYERVRSLGATEEQAFANYVEEQLTPERIHDDIGERAIRNYRTLNLRLRDLYEFKEEVLLKQLVEGTIMRAVFSRRQLYEVMVQFWSDHFNIDPSKGDSQWVKIWDDREVIRKYALGDVGIGEPSGTESFLANFSIAQGKPESQSFRFPDMLRASALSPAMLWYLDGRQNRKVEADDQPNENYARELLELHTLGVDGGYTQQDVMEVARCLTGWTARPRKQPFKGGKVEFQKYAHDDGEKVVLGQKIPAGLGAGDPDRVLEIISLHSSTAHYLATKLCRRFIADQPPANTVDVVAKAFLASKGDIRETLRTLFHTDAFKNTRGNKFKRPFEYVVSALRATDAAVSDRSVEEIRSALLRMGHAPFNFPTPDGYPDEATPWLGSLLWRWNFALSLSENRIDNGIKVNPEAVVRRAGGREQAVAHLLGRKPSELELELAKDSGNPLALLLASPAFQWT